LSIKTDKLLSASPIINWESHLDIPKKCDSRSEGCHKIHASLRNDEQKNNCASVCLDLHEKLQRDPKFLSKDITGDVTVVNGYACEKLSKSLGSGKVHHLHA
jgi:hypothetical protein